MWKEVESCRSQVPLLIWYYCAIIESPKTHTAFFLWHFDKNVTDSNTQVHAYIKVKYLGQLLRKSRNTHIENTQLQLNSEFLTLLGEKYVTKTATFGAVIVEWNYEMVLVSGLLLYLMYRFNITVALMCVFHFPAVGVKAWANFNYFIYDWLVWSTAVHHTLYDYSCPLRAMYL